MESIEHDTVCRVHSQQRNYALPDRLRFSDASWSARPTGRVGGHAIARDLLRAAQEWLVARDHRGQMVSPFSQVPGGRLRLSRAKNRAPW
jgi:hypothetical protein